MRTYLEATEIADVNPEFIRADVTGMSKADQDAIKQAMQDIMQGKTYTMVKHLCRHDKYGQCETQLI